MTPDPRDTDPLTVAEPDDPRMALACPMCGRRPNQRLRKTVAEMATWPRKPAWRHLIGKLRQS